MKDLLSKPPRSPRNTARISFLHRTVVEFLQNSAVWQGLLALTDPQNFDVNMFLGAYLIDIKTQASSEDVDTIKNPVWRSMRACLQYSSRLAETRNQLRTEFFIHELDRVMDHHWRKVGEFHTTSLSHFPASIDGEHGPTVVHWANSVFQTMEGIGDIPEYSDVDESIYSVAAGVGLIGYLKQGLSRPSTRLTMRQYQQCILTAIAGHAGNFKKNSSPSIRTSFARFLTTDSTVPLENYLDIIEILLDRISNSKDKMDSVDKAWSLVLKNTNKLFEYSCGFWNSFVEEEIALWAKLLTLFLRFKVDVNLKIELRAREGAHRQSALLIVTSLFKQLPPRATAMKSIRSARDHIVSIMAARGAIQRERVNGSLVQGPPEESSKIWKVKLSENEPKSSSSVTKGLRKRFWSFRQS